MEEKTFIDASGNIKSIEFAYSYCGIEHKYHGVWSEAINSTNACEEDPNIMLPNRGKAICGCGSDNFIIAWGEYIIISKCISCGTEKIIREG